MDPTISFADLDVIRGMWPGKIVVKGVQNVEDSKKLADLGVDGIVLSNHGGRQLDRAPVPFHLLPEVVREVGTDLRSPIDTGIMYGADIVAAIALGAKFTLDRPRLPLRPDGGRPRGRRPHHRHPARPDRSHHEAARAWRPSPNSNPGHVTQFSRLVELRARTDQPVTR